MAGSVPEIEAIRDQETLEAYLRTYPKVRWQVVALRAAVRVMPTLTTTFHLGSSKRKKLIICVFEILLFAWAVKRFPNHKVRFRSATREAITFADDISDFASASYVSASAFYAALSNFSSEVESARAVSYAVLAARTASDYGRDAVWNVVRADLAYMHVSAYWGALLTPLWPRGSEPDFVAIWEREFRVALGAIGSHWHLVYDFYQELRNGRAPFDGLGSKSEEVLVALSKEKRDFWERDPDEVMCDLTERLGGRKASRQLELGLSAAPAKADFLISYSTENLPVAQEVNGYLKDAGFSTIAQFQDFSTGSNFVTEMQKGLERAGRVVALLSPAYVASKHCQAEWSAAYNRDPSGEQRYLVPLLIEETSLPPLARQIVYRSIVGLTGDARRVAVLEAVGKLLRPEVPDIRSPYDFELTARQTVEATGGAMNTISVLPNRDPNDARRRLEAARETAADLIADLRSNLFQAARHYITELDRYQNRLPLDAGESIYSADVVLRNIRDDLERDIQHGIDDRFLSRAQRLIEAHYGLRIYFPELLEFYEDVRQSRQTEPVPLEALGKLREAIEEHTPDVFEPSVGEAFANAADVVPAGKAESNDALAEAGHPPVTSTLPPDPIANVDPIRAAQHAEMSMQNRIWALLRGVEKGGKALERIEKVSSTYQKWIDPILDWLSKSN